MPPKRKSGRASSTTPPPPAKVSKKEDTSAGDAAPDAAAAAPKTSGRGGNRPGSRGAAGSSQSEPVAMAADATASASDKVAPLSAAEQAAADEAAAKAAAAEEAAKKVRAEHAAKFQVQIDEIENERSQLADNTHPEVSNRMFGGGWMRPHLFNLCPQRESDRRLWMRHSSTHPPSRTHS